MSDFLTRALEDAARAGNTSGKRAAPRVVSSKRSAVQTRTKHTGLYGSVVCEREYCDHCEGMTMVVDNKRLCCDESSAGVPTGTQRLSEPSPERRRPSVRGQREILAAQNDACFYCYRSFGSRVFRKNKLVKLRVNWDHFVPHVYSQNQHDQNFVAACHVCNGLKSDHMFQTADEARAFINERWEVD